MHIKFEYDEVSQSKLDEIDRMIKQIADGYEERMRSCLNPEEIVRLHKEFLRYTQQISDQKIHVIAIAKVRIIVTDCTEEEKKQLLNWNR